MAIEGVSVTDLAKVRTYRVMTADGNVGWSWDRIRALDQASTR